MANESGTVSKDERALLERATRMGKVSYARETEKRRQGTSRGASSTYKHHQEQPREKKILSRKIQILFQCTIVSPSSCSNSESVPRLKREEGEEKKRRRSREDETKVIPYMGSSCDTAVLEMVQRMEDV